MCYYTFNGGITVYFGADLSAGPTPIRARTWVTLQSDDRAGAYIYIML